MRIFHTASIAAMISDAHILWMWITGMALYPAWACGHRLRGGFVPFSDPAASGISIPASKHHAPYPQRSVRAKHQGEHTYIHTLRRPLLLDISRADDGNFLITTDLYQLHQL